MINFEKFHGTGNDFIIFKEEDVLNVNLSQLAQNVCNRHFGIGADGMIVVSKSKIADVKMNFYNADGSIASMCGNGIRCFAKFVYEKKYVNNTCFEVETLAGIMKPEVLIENNIVTGVKVNMGKPKFKSPEIPFGEDFIDKSIIIDNNTFIVSSIFLGTIHTVLFVEDFNNIDINKIGSYIENLDIFPIKTNVNFCKIINKDKLELITWEKGVGITLACGTGACSTMVLANKLKGCDSCVNINVSGGTLHIEKINDEIFMTGPATFICKGQYKIK